MCAGVLPELDLTSLQDSSVFTEATVLPDLCITSWPYLFSWPILFFCVPFFWEKAFPFNFPSFLFVEFWILVFRESCMMFYFLIALGEEKKAIVSEFATLFRTVFIVSFVKEVFVTNFHIRASRNNHSLQNQQHFFHEFQAAQANKCIERSGL